MRQLDVQSISVSSGRFFSVHIQRVLVLLVAVVSALTDRLKTGWQADTIVDVDCRSSVMVARHTEHAEQWTQQPTTVYYFNTWRLRMSMMNYIFAYMLRMQIDWMQTVWMPHRKRRWRGRFHFISTNDPFELSDGWSIHECEQTHNKFSVFDTMRVLIFLYSQTIYLFHIFAFIRCEQVWLKGAIVSWVFLCVCCVCLCCVLCFPQW